MANVGIIGYGRFGRFWADVLKSDHTVIAADIAPRGPAAGVTIVTLEDLCQQAEVIFLCVPISAMESTLQAAAPYLTAGTVVMDTCSVKVQPADQMLRILGGIEGVDLIATHPMFGPDSAAEGLTGQAMMMAPLRTRTPAYEVWRDYLSGRGIHIVEMTPDEHDRLAANSQGVTHYIGRILGELDLRPTPIDTSGYAILRSVVEQTCNDSWELFYDLQHANPYTSEMRLRLERALDKVYSQLLPDSAAPDSLVIGIQGGQGSFNEEACRHYCAEHGIDVYRIEYLYTADKVLAALHAGAIDRGVFALQNARGGVVLETVHGLSRYRCEIQEIFDLVISHCVLTHPEADFGAVDTIISHPQAIAQCSNTLNKKYGHLTLANGEGDLIDQALCARYLAEGDLPPTTAVLAPKVCATIYGLSVQDEGLQDLGDANLTTFVWAQRRHYFR